MCVCVLVVFGISSVFSMELESTPEMSNPVFMVRTSYSGVGPEEVDSLITDPVEAALSSVSDYTSMTSRSSEGSSMTMLQFDYNVDLDDKYREIEDALTNLNLPDDAGDPVIMQMAMDSDSVMTLSIKATSSESLLSYIEENVVPRLENISGVSSVDVSGGKREYIQIEIKEEEMTQYGLSMSSISSAIAAANFTTTAGTINRGEVELSLMGGASYDTADSLKDIPISLSSGDIIHLSDVATVQMAEQSSGSISRQNGMENIRIDISKNQSANTVSLCEKLAERVDELNADNLGLTLEISSNSGETIMDNIQNVIVSLVEGLAVAMLVLLLFLSDPKSALIIATSMPLSVFVALVMMSIYGMTINIMSLGGLVVGIGMMVDNSIVVMESCFQQRSEQRTFAESAEEAARLVAGSIVASTITTVVVFLPIALMEGMAGQLFKDVGFTIVFALTASLVSALTLVPLLFVRTRPVERSKALGAGLLRKLENWYVGIMNGVLRRRLSVILVAILLLGGTAWMFSSIDMELMPMMDRGSISLSVSTKQGLNLDATDTIMRQIEQIVSEQEDVESYSLRGSGGSATLSITLKEDRDVETSEMVETLRTATADIDNCYIEVSQRSAMSFGSSSGGVSVSITGSNLSTLKNLAEQIKADMLGYDGVISATTSLTNGDPRAEIVVDSVQAAAIGMTPAQVLSNVKNMISGVTATSLQDGDSEYSVKVEYPSDRFYDVSDLSGLLLTSSSGGKVPLTDVATIIYTNAPSQIQRSDGKYIVTITAQTSTGVSQTALSNQIMSDLHPARSPMASASPPGNPCA
jgi:multidrug efflux pump subunit AcrB